MIDPQKIQIGRRVVCRTNPEPEVIENLRKRNQRWPTLGMVYTIRDKFPDFEGTTHVRLKEIVNEAQNWGKHGVTELAFPFYIFEPIEDFKVPTDQGFKK